MKHETYCVVVIALFYWLAGCSPAENKTAAPSPATGNKPIDHGKILFEEKCALCHGVDGTAGISNAADLQTSRIDSISVLRAITHGKNAMPAFKEQLGTGEIEQIANYVYSLRK